MTLVPLLGSSSCHIKQVLCRGMGIQQHSWVTGDTVPLFFFFFSHCVVTNTVYMCPVKRLWDYIA